MSNERGRIHEHKALVSPCERRVQNQHMDTVSSVQLTAFAVLLLALAVIKQCCLTEGAPFWIGGELPVFVVRPHAPNREVRTMTVRHEYMYRTTPNIDTVLEVEKKKCWYSPDHSFNDLFILLIYIE